MQRKTLLGALVFLAIAAGCGGVAEPQQSTSNTETSAGEEALSVPETPGDTIGYTDATFNTTREMGDPRHLVNCTGGIINSFGIENASKPLHWKIRFHASGNPHLTADPADGTLVPGQTQIITVGGRFDDELRPNQFDVTIYSPQSPGLYTITLYCNG